MAHAQKPPPSAPPQMPAPNPYSAIQAFQQPSVSKPDTTSLPSIPVPGQPGQQVPSTAQTKQILGAYGDAPGVASAMETLASDHPQYQAPTYHQPNKWGLIASALLGLAFPGAPIGRFAAGFAGGEEAGAEAKYAREQKAAQDQYGAEVDQQSADEKSAQLAVNFTDAQDRIQATKIQNEYRNAATRVRLEQAQQRIGLLADGVGIARDRLTQQYNLAQQRFRVEERGQDITAHDAALGANTRLIGMQFTQLGQDRRAMLSADVRTAVSSSNHIQQTLDSTLVTIREAVNKGKMSKDDAATATSAAIQTAHDQQQALLSGATEGSPLGKISTLSAGLDQGLLQDDESEAQAGGYYTGAGAPQGATGTTNNYYAQPPLTMGEAPPGSVAGGTLNDPHYGWANDPLYGGGAQPAQTGQPAAPHPAAQSPEAYGQQIVTHAGMAFPNAGVGQGPGIAEPAAKSSREFFSQHAADYATASSVVNAMLGENPGMVKSMSQAQLASVLEVWAHTRRAHGQAVDIPPPPGQQDPTPSAQHFGQPGVMEGPPAPNQASPATHHAAAGPAAPHPVAATPPVSPGPQATVGEAVVQAAKQVGVPPQLVFAIIQAESSGNQGAVSKAGAIGRGQLMPGTAADMGLDPHDPGQNIYGTARYIKGLLEKFHSIPLAVAAYNAGPGAVQKYRGVPPFPETRTYVARVLQNYKSLLGTP
jgi:hypothetical protein